MCINKDIICVNEKGLPYSSHTDFEIINMINLIDELLELNNDVFANKKAIGIVIEKMKENLNLLLNKELGTKKYKLG